VKLFRSLVPLAIVAGTAIAHADSGEPLPRIGPAPTFALTSQDGRPLSLPQLRGKVVAVTFMFTGCGDTCPVLTAKLVSIQRQLKAAEAGGVHFVAITLTPETDTPDVLKRYAQLHGADMTRWSFLTGDWDRIHELARQYGVYVKKQSGKSAVDHAFLTSIVDHRGTIRVQYMGVRFKPEEFIADLRGLLREAGSP
jgi:protein SCO1/2